MSTPLPTDERKVRHDECAVCECMIANGSGGWVAIEDYDAEVLKRKQAELEKDAAVGDVMRLTLQVEGLARELTQVAKLGGQLLRDKHSHADLPKRHVCSFSYTGGKRQKACVLCGAPAPTCICGQGDKPATVHFSGCPVSPLYDPPDDVPAPLPKCRHNMNPATCETCFALGER